MAFREAAAFQRTPLRQRSSSICGGFLIGTSVAPTTTLCESWNKNIEQEENEVVELGSREYIQGMVSRSLDAEPAERVTGDKILGPTLRLAGVVTGFLVLLVLAFLASNGIISF